MNSVEEQVIKLYTGNERETLRSVAKQVGRSIEYVRLVLEKNNIKRRAPGPRVCISEDLKNEVINRFKNEYISISKLAKEVGLKYCQVYKILNTSEDRRRRNPQIVERVSQLLQEGKSCYRISKILGMSCTSICRIKKILLNGSGIVNK